MTTRDGFSSKSTLATSFGDLAYFRLDALSGEADVERLPFSIRIMLENLLRFEDGHIVQEEDVLTLARWAQPGRPVKDLAFRPARVILQDFTGVPAVVDLAAMRSALHRMGGDPSRINPQVPVDLVIDHSVQVDAFGVADARSINEALEFKRNYERYAFLRWGQTAFENFRTVPPGTGIVHQVNLEYLGQGVIHRDGMAFPDTLVGTDSHTTMINGLGVMGWGVGGIEAEAVMLGQPLYMPTPDVVGMRLFGRLREGVTATDLVLTVTEILRKLGVVGKFVEFIGPGLDELPLADRATIANMSPEYGATMGFFPVDEQTLTYLKLTGRSDEQIQLVETYCKENHLFRTGDNRDIVYSDVVELDMSTVEPSLAGPKRPQDRVPLFFAKSAFQKALTAPVAQRGFGLTEDQLDAAVPVQGMPSELMHGSVVIAAITSCTNTSNPAVLVGAGLLARHANARGLKTPPHVKTSLAPGSRVVTSYLENMGLDRDLEALGFFTVGYGCTTCIGNSGPLPEPIQKAIAERDLVVCSVLSGNRNFEGRINPHVKANYLASPMLVVAYAIAGTLEIDFETQPLGHDTEGKPVFLKEIWPDSREIQQAIATHLTPELFSEKYADVFKGDLTWQTVEVGTGQLYDWQEESTYIQEPPFFQNMSLEVPRIQPIRDMRALALLGDSVTTDHISPAGSFSPDTPAGRYLRSKGVDPKDFNSYGSRRGNDQVMTRGTFANIRLRNQLAPGTEGGFTRDFTTDMVTDIFSACQHYQQQSIPLIVVAGKEYGTGSSRDWAAKGTFLLGVKAVLAESFERIHRSNLAGMGVLPLQFTDGQSAASLSLTGEEIFSLPELSDDLKPGQHTSLVIRKPDLTETRISVLVRLDTPMDVTYYRHGGILHAVLRELAQPQDRTK